MIEQPSKQITVMAFDMREFFVYIIKTKSGNWIVPFKFFKLFPDFGMIEELGTVPRIHLVDRVSKFRVVKISHLGLR